jgi:membrane-associated phospholipid phosphatase
MFGINRIERTFDIQNQNGMTYHFTRWLPLHKILVLYCLLTVVISLLPGIDVNPFTFYIPKLIIFIVVLSWPVLRKHLSDTGLNYINAFLGGGFLAFFYNETAQLNQVSFDPVDPLLIDLEHSIFGIQPSLSFSASLPDLWMVELMNLGYLSYYFIIISFLIILIHRLPGEFNRMIFIVSQSFIIYYLIFIFIPSWGPQFWFEPPHNQIPQGVFFQKIMAFIQHTGEAPTGAIPSSHVGITVIICILAYRKLGTFLKIIAPFVTLLILSTVYIKAHYLLDVIAGLVSAPVILFIAEAVWNKLNNQNQPTPYVAHHIRSKNSSRP